MGVYKNNNGTLTPIANETQFIAPVNEYVTKPELASVESQVTELQYSSAYLNDSKIEKEKEYTEIVGINAQGLWNVITSQADTQHTNYSYSVYDSNFTAGDYVYIKGFQVTSINNYPAIMFYDTNMHLLLSLQGDINTMVSYEMFIPENTTYIYINGHTLGHDFAPTLKKITFNNINIATQSDIEYIDDIKLNKEKLYTSIEGVMFRGLWKIDKTTQAYDNYAYKIITSGFNVGERIAIDGFQPTSYASFPLCVFYDDNMNQIGIVNPPEGNKIFNKYEVVIPNGTTQFYINGYYNSNTNNTNAVAYTLTYSELAINEVINPLNYAVKNWMERRYQDGEYLQFTQKTLDHAIITFSIDDSNSDVSDVSDLFISKGVPLCLATIPDKLNYLCNNGDTVLQTCLKTVNNGGEILTHNAQVIDASTTAQGYYDYFVTSKQKLENAGLKVRGIIKAGGGTDDPNIKTALTYLRSYYDYGTGFGFVTDARYNNMRYGLVSPLLNLKGLVDAVASGGIVNFYCHGASDVGNDWITKISDLIDYIQSINGAEIVTIGSMFTNNFVPSFKQ